MVTKKLMAEAAGTVWLVLGGCGSAVLAAGFPELGIGFAGVALAFGLTVLTGAYALAHISGAHFTPAVTLGLWAAGRVPAGLLVPYVVAQVAGGLLGAGVIYLIARGAPDFDVHAGFASNGFGMQSPAGFSLTSALLTEVILTAMFVVVIMGATHPKAPSMMGPLACYRTLSHACPSDFHSGRQHICEPCPQYRNRGFRRRGVAYSTMALLGGTPCRRSPGRFLQSLLSG